MAACARSQTSIRRCRGRHSAYLSRALLLALAGRSRADEDRAMSAVRTPERQPTNRGDAFHGANGSDHPVKTLDACAGNVQRPAIQLGVEDVQETNRGRAVGTGPKGKQCRASVAVGDTGISAPGARPEATVPFGRRRVFAERDLRDRTHIRPPSAVRRWHPTQPADRARGLRDDRRGAGASRAGRHLPFVLRTSAMSDGD